MTLQFQTIALIAMLWATTFSNHNSATNKLPIDPVVEQKITELLSKMTLEEKIGQMTLYTTDWGSTGPTIRPGYSEDIRKGRCGALFNAQTVAFTRELQRIAVEESRLKIPLLFGFDVIHGYKTIFPIPLGEAASWDMAAIEKAAEVAAAEAAAAGLHWTFAPMVDISRDPRWGRVLEGAGEDTKLGCDIAAARVRGFQGKNFKGTDRVMACVKHFAAYGAPTAGRDYNTVELSERSLREWYLPPYKAAIDAGARTAMSAFNEYDGTPAHGSEFLLSQVLRKEMGFEGFVVTDYTGINEMVEHGNVANEKEAGELAVNVGNDMDMQGAVYQTYLKQSVEEGKVSVKTIDQAVRRILRMKFELGLFDDPYKFCDAEREKRTLLAPAHLEVALDVARKSIVLLRNQNQTLPLSATTKNIALIGPLANDRGNLIGAWSGSGEAKDCVTLLEGMKAYTDRYKTSIVYEKGCEVSGTDKTGFAAAVAAAQKADLVVVAIGEDRDMSGEASCRTDITLPGMQEDLVRALIETGKPVVVVLMNGRPLAIPYVAENAQAILETWWLGTQAGNAIADVVFGTYNPSGKLPVTFPRSIGQVPIYYNTKNTGRPFDPNSKWTSKYIDSPNTPQFPFGFGLSYTTFAYGKPTVNQTLFKFGQPLQVSVTVENTGKLEGVEVVQLYVRDLVGSVTRPVKELKGYKKVNLKPGEKQNVVFTITSDDLRFFTHNMTFKAEPGDFEFMLGTSSAETQSVKATLER